MAASAACLQPQLSLPPQSSGVWFLPTLLHSCQVPHCRLRQAVFFQPQFPPLLRWPAPSCVRLSLVQACPLPPQASHTCIHLQTAFQGEPFAWVSLKCSPFMLTLPALLFILLRSPPFIHQVRSTVFWTSLLPFPTQSHLPPGLMSLIFHSTRVPHLIPTVTAFIVEVL